jgi:hypothetical protein
MPALGQNRIENGFGAPLNSIAAGRKRQKSGLFHDFGHASPQPLGTFGTNPEVLGQMQRANSPRRPIELISSQNCCIDHAPP